VCAKLARRVREHKNAAEVSVKIDIRDDEETKRHRLKRQVLSHPVMIDHPGTSNTRLITMGRQGRNSIVYVTSPNGKFSSYSTVLLTEPPHSITVSSFRVYNTRRGTLHRFIDWPTSYSSLSDLTGLYESLVAHGQCDRTKSPYTVWSQMSVHTFPPPSTLNRKSMG